MAHPRSGYLSNVSRSNWNLDCWFLRREENRSTRRKTLGAETRTNNKLNPHMTLSPGIEPGPHWWEASALTTVPSLLPYFLTPSYTKFISLNQHVISITLRSPSLESKRLFLRLTSRGHKAGLNCSVIAGLINTGLLMQKTGQTNFSL